ncbi:MAG: hypothetical protein HGA45_27665 [Chloroflexales bacterium]|nr:hypothetical protein [Chloroflexales bacterium]
MNKRIVLLIAGAVIVVAMAAGWLLMTTRSQAIGTLTQSVDTRPEVQVFPSAFGLDYEEVLVESADGTRLVGWYIPSQNGAAIIAQHGTSRTASRC